MSNSKLRLLVTGFDEYCTGTESKRQDPSGNEFNFTREIEVHGSETLTNLKRAIVNVLGIDTSSEGRIFRFRFNGVSLPKFSHERTPFRLCDFPIGAGGEFAIHLKPKASRTGWAVSVRVLSVERTTVPPKRLKVACVGGEGPRWGKGGMATVSVARSPRTTRTWTRRGTWPKANECLRGRHALWAKPGKRRRQESQVDEHEFESWL
eukprot:tig00021254_g19697.t1